MKNGSRMIAIGLLMGATFLFAGCTAETSPALDPPKDKGRFNLIYVDPDDSFHIYVDRETGCQFVEDSNNSLIPLFQADGRPYCPKR
jgi:hypothetical protein